MEGVFGKLVIGLQFNEDDNHYGVTLKIRSQVGYQKFMMN